ncbi:MAG: VWA domain-containing protein [Spirochaetes bacterium]|nr:VWA domain-containing protein [Spirochaetota bacterium]
MNFERPLALFGALLALPYLLHAAGTVARSGAFAVRFAPHGLGKKARTRAMRASALSAACGSALIALASVGLAGPSFGYEYPVSEGSGAELAFLLDVSNSMLAEDILPNRLAAACELVRFVIRARPGSRYSLTVAKGGATTLVPMTDDVAAFDDALEFANPAAVTAPSTDLGAGTAAAAKTFTGTGGLRALVILSDGDDRAGTFQSSAAAVRADGILVVGVAFGGTKGVPVADADGSVVLDRDGRPALAAAFPDALAAAASGGAALRPENAMNALCDIIDAAAGKGGLSISPRRHRDVSGLFFLAAAALAAARFFLSPTGALA